MTFYDDEESSSERDYDAIRDELEDEGYSPDEIERIIDDLEESEEPEELDEWEELEEEPEELEYIYENYSEETIGMPVIATFFSAEDAEDYCSGAPEGVLFWETVDGEHFLIHRMYE